MRRVTIMALLLALVPTFTPSVLAQGKGKGKGQNQAVIAFSLEMANDVNANGLPNFGDSVRFSAATTTNAFISVNCYQGASYVYAAGGYPADSVLMLAADSWPGGAADCSATLYTTTDGSRTTTLATLSFHVSE